MISAFDRSLVENVAIHQGFEFVDPSSSGALTVSSSLVPGILSIRRGSANDFLIDIDLPLVAAALRKEFQSNDGRSVRAEDEGELYRMLGRAFHLCAALPDKPLKSFELATKGLPRKTEAERLAVQRIGQDIFRTALERYWERRCPITGIEDPALLRASHIKPWSESNDDERLDVFNGFLFAAHLDAAFDKHLMTVLPDGTVCFSSRLSAPALVVLNAANRRLHITLSPFHTPYLDQHRARFAELESAGA